MFSDFNGLPEFNEIRVRVKVNCDGPEKERILEDLNRNECREVYRDLKHFAEYGELKIIQRKLANYYHTTVRTIRNWVRDNQ